MGSHTPYFYRSFPSSCQWKYRDEYPRLLKPNLSWLPHWAPQPISSYICLLNYMQSLCRSLGWSETAPLIPEQKRASCIPLLKAQSNTQTGLLRGQGSRESLPDPVLGAVGHTRCCSLKPCKQHALNLSWLLMDQKNMLLMLQSIWAFLSWSNPRCPIWTLCIHGYMKGAGLLTCPVVTRGHFSPF